MNNKGQGVGIDLVLAIITGLALLLYISVVFQGRLDEAVESQKINWMKEKALVVGEGLIVGSGYPETWVNDVNRAQIVGLAKKPFELDALKVDALNRLDYNRFQASVGLQGFGVRLIISDINQNILQSFGQAPAQSTRAVQVERWAKLNGQPVRVSVNVWK